MLGISGVCVTFNAIRQRPAIFRGTATATCGKFSFHGTIETEGKVKFFIVILALAASLAPQPAEAQLRHKLRIARWAVANVEVHTEYRWRQAAPQRVYTQAPRQARTYQPRWGVAGGDVAEHLIRGAPGKHPPLPRSYVEGLSISQQYWLHDWYHDRAGR